MGLLPDLAPQLPLSIPKTGILVSGYALSVTLGSLWWPCPVAHGPQAGALILMACFWPGMPFVPWPRPSCFCSLLAFLPRSAMAPSLARQHRGFSSGPRSERAQAIAIMFSGLTTSECTRGSRGTALGQAFGWRFAFWPSFPFAWPPGIGLFHLVPHSGGEDSPQA